MPRTRFRSNYLAHLEAISSCAQPLGAAMADTAVALSSTSMELEGKEKSQRDLPWACGVLMSAAWE